MDIDWHRVGVIVGLACMTVLARSFFLFSGRTWSLPSWAQRGLHYAPIAALVDSARTVVAGLFLIFPGLISDFIALTLLLLPLPSLSEPLPARGFGNVVDGQFRRER